MSSTVEVLDTAKYIGRKVIYTDAEEITEANVLYELGEALNVHYQNQGQIKYLYDYYRGNQPILGRTKDVRPEINNKIVENRANQIVAFKTGYLMGEPVQYVARGNDESVLKEIEELNDYIFSEDKGAKDKKLADWMHICGTAYRMALPDKTGDEDESPFEIYTLDPRYTFVVYRNDLGNEPLMAVKYVEKKNNVRVFAIYTKNRYFEVTDTQITKSEFHSLGYIPIIEYPLNEARLGSFEVVLTMLDAINKVDSNRLDGVEQFVQALLMFKGVDIDSDDFKALKDQGGLKVPVDGDAKYLVQELNQSQTQTLKEDMYTTIREIVGMPASGNGSGSDSSNNGAMIVKNGWHDAEARAKDTEEMFKESEKRFLKLILNITNTLRDKNLKLKDIDIRFTRRNYEDIQSKAQVLTTLLGSEKVHPKLAFEHCGMFSDPNLAYTMSKEYIDEAEKKQTEELTNAFSENRTGENLNEGGVEE